MWDKAYKSGRLFNDGGLKWSTQKTPAPKKTGIERRNALAAESMVGTRKPAPLVPTDPRLLLAPNTSRPNQDYPADTGENGEKQKKQPVRRPRVSGLRPPVSSNPQLPYTAVNQQYPLYPPNQTLRKRDSRHQVNYNETDDLDTSITTRVVAEDSGDDGEYDDAVEKTGLPFSPGGS